MPKDWKSPENAATQSTSSPNLGPPVKAISGKTSSPSAVATRSQKAPLVSPLTSDLNVKRQVQADKAAQQIDAQRRENQNLTEQLQIVADERGELREQNERLQKLVHELQESNQGQMAATAPGLDSVVAPKTFSGDKNEDMNEWVEFLDSYIAFRKIEYTDAQNLIPLFLRGSASEWWKSLETKPTSMANFVTAFKAQFKPTGAAKWGARNEMWNRRQLPNEKVGLYVEEMKAMARRLNIDDETTMWAIVNGLKTEIRPSVIESNPKDMGELKLRAELAESARGSNFNDGIEAAIKRLEARLFESTVTAPIETERTGGIARTIPTLPPKDEEGGTRRGRTYSGRGRNWQPRGFGSGRSSYDSRRTSPWRGTPERTSGESCSKCSLYHEPGQCRIHSDTECFHCRRRGHSYRVCRGQRPHDNYATRNRSASPGRRFARDH